MTPVARAAVAGALRELGPRLPDLVRQAGDPARPAVGSWTVGDVAAHLVSIVELYPQILRDEGSPRRAYDQTTRDNQDALVEVGTTDPAELADRLDVGAARCLEHLDHAPREVAWHGGLRLPTETVAAVLAGEYAVHGYDLATASNQALRLEGEHVCAIWHGLGPLLPYYVNPDAASGVDATIRVRLRGTHGPPTVLRFHDGRLEVARSDEGRADCTISADPTSWMLVAYGRLGPLRPSLTGRIVAWGRKPWLGAKLPSLLRAP